MPEVGDHYRVADILQPSVDQMARGHAVAWSCDASENVMGRAHANPIQDTKMYQVRLTGGEVTGLTVNITADLMYAQCDEEGSVQNKNQTWSPL